jgi:alpha-L-rhamnosidase
VSIPDRYAGHYFRRAFDIPGRVASARLYFSGTGLLQNCLNRRTPQACRVAGSLMIPSINGQRLSDRQLDSAPSAVNRPLYTSLDVTSFLRPGANVLGMSVAGDTSFLAQLEVVLIDGRRVVVGSGGEWQTRPNAYLHVDRFAGTRYDARNEIAGWDAPGYTADDEWSLVEDRAAIVGAVTLSSDSSLPPMRIVKRWPPAKIERNAAGSYTLDFGQNITGRVRIRLRGRAGQELAITHAERLNSRGEADKFGTAFYTLQTDRYTFGTDIADWSPEFSYYGFRYVTISGLDAPPNADQVWAEQVNTDLELTGRFASSSDLLNRIHAGAIQTTLNNAHGIPEDCPHREKRGWSQDAYVGSPQAFANFDMTGFYDKWLRDARDAQRPNGAGTDIAPAEVSYAVDGDSTWASVLVYLPWDLYRETGDLRYIERSYDSMRRFVEWEIGQAREGLLPKGIYVGDWVAHRQTDDGLLRNTFWYGVVRQVEDAARLLGKREDEERYHRLADQIRDKVNAAYLDPASGIYGPAEDREGKTSQASMAVPLAMDLVPHDLRGKVGDRLARYIEEVSKGHPESGLTATRFVLEGLASIDRPDLIHQMVTRRGAPGWAEMIERGPGTMGEDWEGGSSLNHPWTGVIDAFFYRIYAGIQSDGPGFRTMTIKPFVPDDLAWVEASRPTPFGSIALAWRKQGGILTLDVRIPVGAEATILVPTRGEPATADHSCADCGSPRAAPTALAGFTAFKAGSGRYRFTSHGWPGVSSNAGN